jgi:hypothetical protein
MLKHRVQDGHRVDNPVLVRTLFRKDRFVSLGCTNGHSCHRSSGGTLEDIRNNRIEAGPLDYTQLGLAQASCQSCTSISEYLYADICIAE